MAKKLRTRGHKVVLNRSRGGDAGITIMHHLDDYGGQRYEVGYSSAIAVVLFVIMYGSNYVIKKALSKVGQ